MEWGDDTISTSENVDGLATQCFPSDSLHATSSIETMAGGPKRAEYQPSAVDMLSYSTLPTVKPSVVLDMALFLECAKFILDKVAVL